MHTRACYEYVCITQGARVEPLTVVSWGVFMPRARGGGVARYPVGAQGLFTESDACGKVAWSYLHVAPVSTCEGSGLACVPW